MVCSILGLCTGGFGALLGVIFGHIALSEIKKSNDYLQGRGMAIAGLIIGYAQIALGVLLVVFVVIAASIPPTQ
jgi:hypothetical protein